jgi:hypothetical protein
MLLVGNKFGFILIVLMPYLAYKEDYTLFVHMKMLYYRVIKLNKYN